MGYARQTIYKKTTTRRKVNANSKTTRKRKRK